MIVTLEPELLDRLSRLDGANTAAEVEELDADLAAAVRQAGVMRRLFYAAVLAVALYGTATGAVARFALPWPVAIGGIFALELGGVVFLSNAETRRRLGEHAALSRLLGTIVAAAAAAFNLLSHRSLPHGVFFALMSLLGFLAWWLDVENKRRDRLRARGKLAATTPAYELWGHWLRHPLVTNRARGLARAYPQLGLYGSVAAALIIMRQEQRNAALAQALRRRIRRAIGKDMADIAVLTFDIDEVARRLRDAADYDGLTALLGSELTAERVLHGRDDHAALAARAWLADHRGHQPPPTPGPPPHEDEHRSPTRPSTPGLPPAPQQHDSDDSAKVPAPATAGTPHPPPAHRNGHTPRASDHSATLSVPTIRPGLPNGIAVSLNGADTHHTAPPAGQPHPAAAPDPWPAGQVVGSCGGAGRIDASTGNRPNRAAADQAAVKVRVLGAPAILDTDGSPVRGLRTKSTELLIYLAVHRDGAPLADILAAIWPDVTPQRATQRLSTCLANLRSIIRQVRVTAGTNNPDGHTRVEPVINTGGHYHLDPTIVAVDWWQALDAYARAASSATNASDQATWRHMINAALNDIAKDSNYPWIDTEREHARHALAQAITEPLMLTTEIGSSS
jgi:hypothetical protein